MNKAFEQAVQLLAKREYSCYELKQKLVSKGHDANDVDRALAQCQQSGYQNDSRFVEQYCQYRMKKGDGPLKIRYALQQKGIASDLIEQHFDTVDWYDQATFVYKEKFNRLGDENGDIKTRQKQIRYMQGKGFDFEQIRACYANYED